MKNKNIITAVSAFILFILFFPSAVSAEIKRLEIEINGLSCPFCVFGLKKQMQKIETVKRLSINLKKGSAVIIPRENSIFNISDYTNSVKRAGFSVRGILITAAGRVEKRNDFLVLRVSKTNQLFILGHSRGLEAGYKVLVKGSVRKRTEDKLYRILIEKIDII